jgi:hypothetical protein
VPTGRPFALASRRNVDEPRGGHNATSPSETVCFVDKKSSWQFHKIANASPVNIDHLGIQDPQKRQCFALYRPDALHPDVELLDMSAIEPIARPFLLGGPDPVHVSLSET